MVLLNAGSCSGATLRWSRQKPVFAGNSAGSYGQEQTELMRLLEMPRSRGLC